MPAEEVFIAIGSNIGDSITIVEQSLGNLSNINNCRLIDHSSLYRSEAVSEIDQPEYINAVARIETTLEPLALLLELQAIEYAYYRRRDSEQKWAPRTLDLDIILFGNRSLNDSHLIIPHAEFHRRLFVLEPLMEISGDRYIPGYGSLQYLVEQAPKIAMQKLDASEHHG